MVRLSLLSKAKNEPLATQPVVIGKPSKNPVTRAAKKPRLRPGSGPDNDPNPVYAQNSDPDDLDFVPVSTRTDDTTSRTTRSSKKRAISAAQVSSAKKPPHKVALVPHPEIVARSEPYGQPLIWAEERQNLCEALPYYRAYQSGAYTFGNLAYGFLLDKDSSGARSYMDEEIVITRAGGGCKTDASGNMQQNQNQSGDAAQITSFKNCIKQKHAVALILGSANQDCSVVIPHRYSVMDWFQVTYVWAEKFNGKVCYKFRFEKIELEKKSWWAPKGSPLPPSTRNFDTQAPLYSCVCCHSMSKEVYRDGWMCLNEKCARFFMLNGQTPANPSYSVKFLNERSEWPKSIRLGSLKPEPLMIDQGNASFNYSRVSWKGMVCPQCGRCNSRVHWARWECHAESCTFSHDIQLTPLSHKLVLSSHGFQGNGHAVPQDKHANPIMLREPAFLGNWRIHTFEVMAGTHSCAVVTHFHANTLINQMSGGANDMFHALQEADLGLQRFPLKSTRVRGEMLTKHFISNYVGYPMISIGAFINISAQGMPYNYIVAVDSKPFKGAPKAIMNGLNRLTWAGKHTVGDTTFLQFNELLALGYFEEQSIGYHDDGETGLGPTIATLSLGGEADMTIRMKERYYSGKKIKFDPYDHNAPVIEGCQFYEKRLELNTLHKNGGSSRVLRAREAKLRRMVQEDGRTSAPVILNMRLHHGDMVVMHGSEMQKYFEHAVTPLGKLRFALTARYVDPAKINSSEHWKGEFFMDPATVYNGDLDSLDDVTGEFSPQDQDTQMEDTPIENNILLSSQDPVTVYKSDIGSLDDAPNELLPQNQDTPMKDCPADSNTLLSSQDPVTVCKGDIDSLDDVPREVSPQNQDTPVKDNSVESNILLSSQDPATMDKKDIDSPDDVPIEVSPQGQDTPMKDSLIESDALLGSQVTLVADDPSVSPTQAPDHLGGYLHEHVADKNLIELEKAQVQELVDPMN